MALFAANQESEIKWTDFERTPSIRDHRRIWETFLSLVIYVYTSSIQLDFSQAENVIMLITHVEFGNTRQTLAFQHPKSSSPTCSFLEFHRRLVSAFWLDIVSVIKMQRPLSSGIHNGLGTGQGDKVERTCVLVPAQSHARL